MSSDDEEFMEAYKKVFQSIDHQKQGGHVVVNAGWRSPKNLRRGDWVMYLPLSITEQMDEIPRMAKVEKIELRNRLYVIMTTLGVMQIPEHESVQVVI